MDLLAKRENNFSMFPFWEMFLQLFDDESTLLLFTWLRDVKTSWREKERTEVQ